MSPRLLIIVLLVCVALATLFIRVPLFTGGYFNFGDVAVVFAGLVVGTSMRPFSTLTAGLVGGIGSAIADVLTGYALFAPITLIAKGLEGALASIAAKQNIMLRYLLLAAGGSLMVSGYFVGEWILPSTGLQAAIGELIPNAVQAVGGAVGGVLLFHAFRAMVGTDFVTNA